MTVKLLVDWKDFSNGMLYKVGNLLTTDAGTEAGLIASKQADSNLTGGTAYVAPVEGETVDEVGTANMVRAVTDPSTGQTVLVGADGSSVLRGPMASAVWFTCPSVFRLRLTGSGSVQLDSRDSAGTVTAVATYIVSGATDQIEFPYAGDNAVAIRATLTGTTTAEVI